MPRRSPIAQGLLLAAGLAVAALAADDGSFGQLDERRAAALAALDFGGMSNSMAIAVLQDPLFPQVRVDAARVLASEADPAKVMLVRQFAGDGDPWTRTYAMVAAGRIGEPALEVALAGLDDGVPLVRQAAAWASLHGGARALEPIVRLLGREREASVLETAIANLWRLGDALWEPHAARFAGDPNSGLRRAAAVALARSDRPERSEALRRLAADPEPVIRATALSGLAAGPADTQDQRLVLAGLADSDWRVQAAACLVLAARPEIEVPDAPASSAAALWSAEPVQLAVTALRAAGAHRGIGSDAALAALATRSEPWPAAEALAALAGRGAPQAVELATGWIDGGDLWQRRAAARVAPQLPAEAAAAVERKVVADREAAVRLAWLEALEADAASSREEVLGSLLQDPDAAVRARTVELLTEAGGVLRTERLLALAESWSADEMPDARAAALVAALRLAADGDREAIVARGLADPNRGVAAMVVNEARSLGLAAALPHGQESRHGRQWYRDLLRWVEEDRWLDVVTVRGTFRIRLELDETPITSREVWELTERGFYDGLTIHRVVPNFVVQGGDPRGDGWGGPGFVLPDEPTARPFDSYRVGIATAGPQTGGCQLFVTLLPADRLTGHYTNLGEVVAGREVLERLQVGDRIVRVEAAAGPEPPRPTPVLLGRLQWEDLAGLSGWSEVYDGYAPNPEALDRLSSAAGSYRIVVVLGTWCSDSEREVPRLARVLDDVGNPGLELVLTGVDRSKRVADPEIIGLLPDGPAVERVPTIIVLDELGREMGRVVETAERPIEELLVGFLAPAEGWP